MERTLEQRTIAKVSWRLLPLIVVIYFVAYMDRTNVSFASLSMNKDLGFSLTDRIEPGSSSWVISCSRRQATSFWKRRALASGSPAS
jgi:hypothetical protein